MGRIERAFKRALRDTIAAQKTVRFMWFGGAILATGGGAWLGAVAPGSADAQEAVLRAIVGGLAALATLVVFIFVWNLIRPPTAGAVAEPSIQIRVYMTRLVYADSNDVLVEVSLGLHASLPVQMNDIKLAGLGKDIHEYPKKRKLRDESVNTDLYCSAFFAKPRKLAGQRRARISISTGDGSRFVSDRFTVDLDQGPILTK